MARFRDRHIVVSGAGTGIGRAVARRLASEGAKLTLLARRRGPLDAVAAEVGRAHVAGCDIRVREEVDRAFGEAVAAQGPLFALIACSGAGGANEGGEDDRFEELVATNLTGTYWCARAAERHLEDGPEARHLVLIASILARIGVPGYTGYCASKAGLLGLARSLAAELAPRNVQVNALCPGWVDTDMAWSGLAGIAEATGVTPEEAYVEAMRAVPLGRMSRPEDMAGTVAWLLSEDARGVTGQAIDQNNGAWMG